VNDITTCPLCGEATLKRDAGKPGECLNRGCRYNERLKVQLVMKDVQEMVEPLLERAQVLKGIIDGHEKLVQGINWMLCSFGKLRDEVVALIGSAVGAKCSEEEIYDRVTELLTKWRLHFIEKVGGSLTYEDDYVL
jgi:hypothetical protein